MALRDTMFYLDILRMLYYHNSSCIIIIQKRILTCIPYSAIAPWSLEARVQTDLQPLRIYLDTCCLSRSFDDQTQTRILWETQAIRRILAQVRIGHWHWISSDVLVREVAQIPNLEQRFEVNRLLTYTHQTVTTETDEISRAKQLETLGFKVFDALHLACAESAAVDIFLTTDDGILRIAKRENAELRLQIENPDRWLHKEL